jgi:phenylacetate-CoA ligase
LEGAPLIWDKENECRSRESFEAIQLERLRETLHNVYENVPLYRQRFDKMGVKPGDLKKLEDLRNYPMLTKQDMRDNFPYGLFARPLKDVVRLHASSGTTGVPTVVGYTRRDLDTWAELVARLATGAGVTNEDIAHVAFGYGMFTGAFGLHYGLERIGASVIPVSAGNTDRQLQVMQSFGSTALICTPSYALRIAEVGRQMGFLPGGLKLKVGLFGAEPWSERMRQEIEAGLEISATDNYGLSEVVGPGISGECACKDGMHISEDHFFIEVVDPDTLEPVAPGNSGELIITALTKEAFPVVRYRTRDISSITYEPCKCGRTTARMQRVTGRTDDMLIIRGVNVFPSQIETVLLDVEGTAPHYQIVIERNGAMDEAHVVVEVSEQTFSDQARQLYKLQQKIEHRIFAVLGIDIPVRLVEPMTIERTAGKAKRVVDNRNI